VTLIAVDDPDAFTSDTPTAVLIHQALGAVALFERTSLVAKLAGARSAKRALTGRCEGRKPAPDAAKAMAQALRDEGATLRAIPAQLASAGFLAPSGAIYSPNSIACMMH